MKARLQAAVRGESAQAIAEFALIVPVLAFMLLGAAEMGSLYAQKAAQDRATGVVADWAAARPADDWHVVAAREMPDCDVTVTTDALGILTAASTCIYTPKVTAGLWDGIPVSSTADAVTSQSGVVTQTDCRNCQTPSGDRPRER